jgi:hypothetical protein
MGRVIDVAPKIDHNGNETGASRMRSLPIRSCATEGIRITEADGGTFGRTRSKYLP